MYIIFNMAMLITKCRSKASVRRRLKLRRINFTQRLNNSKAVFKRSGENKMFCKIA